MDALALKIQRLGRADYEPCWRRMQAFTDQRDSATADELWLVEHPPVYTLGQAASRDHVLAPGQIPVIQVDRGGQVTYHGPGQAVLYPLWDLRRRKIGIRGLVTMLEQAVINWLGEQDIEAERRDGAPGIFVAGRKIASLGLRVRRGCSFHGLAVNVAMDLEPFARINPCGFAGLEMTQTSALGGSDSWQAAGEGLIQHLVDLSGHQPMDPVVDQNTEQTRYA